MKTKVANQKPHAERKGEPKLRRTRNKPKVRLIRSPRGRIQKLFINGRIERVNLGHGIDPETCAFLPILNQIVVISNVESEVRCYAKPLKSEESGYEILTFSEDEVIDSQEAERRLKLTTNAVKGLKFNECALNCAEVREKYLQNLHVRNLNNACDERETAPKLFIRYGDRLTWKNEQRRSGELVEYRSK